MTGNEAVEELQVVGNFFLNFTLKKEIEVSDWPTNKNQQLLHHRLFFDNLLVIEELQVVDHLLNMLQ